MKDGMRPPEWLETRWRGFSLVEVVLALGIVSIALIGIVGMIPVGVNAMKRSVDGTVTSFILQDVRERMSTLACSTATTVPVYYYDAKGAFVESDGGAMPSQAYYRVNVKLGQPSQAPAYTGFLAACVTIGWPAFDAAGNASRNQIKTSFFVTPLTDPGWQVVDPNFSPKIDL